MSGGWESAAAGEPLKAEGVGGSLPRQRKEPEGAAEEEA